MVSDCSSVCGLFSLEKEAHGVEYGLIGCEVRIYITVKSNC